MESDDVGDALSDLDVAEAWIGTERAGWKQSVLMFLEGKPHTVFGPYEDYLTAALVVEYLQTFEQSCLDAIRREHPEKEALLRVPVYSYIILPSLPGPS